MAIILSAQLPDTAAGTRRVREGTLVRLGRGIYSDEVRKTPERIVQENWQELLGLTMPGAVVTDRSAFAMRPVDGFLFVAADRARVLEFPGLTIVARAGEPAQPDDTPAGHGIFFASEQRGLIENLTASRAAGGRPPRTLTRPEFHDQVVHIASNRSQEQQRRILASVREYGNAHNRQDDADSIDIFFEAARGDRPTVKSDSRSMQAARVGRPYDAHRVRRFRALAADFTELQPKVRLMGTATQDHYLPFFDAYFSNFIEGTEFSVEDAADIALNGHISEERPEDAHDILGTYRILNDPQEMGLKLGSAKEFLETLTRRHAAIMEGRPTKRPGLFKERANRAGDTEFVDPAQVKGTLIEGWEILQQLETPFARAAFMMFLVSEVHPFDDGNGRLSRMMMNAELEQAGSTHVLIPTVLRLDYLSALSSLTHHGRSDGLVTVLDFAQRYVAQMDFADFDYAVRLLDATKAFTDAAQAERTGVRLILPSSLPLGWESAEPSIDVANAEVEDYSLIDNIVALNDDRSELYTPTRAGDLGASTDRGQFARSSKSSPEVRL
jgi:hypothetical protein